MPDYTETLRPGGLSLTQKALSLCHLTPPADVLDIGCGAGATVRFLCAAGFRAAGVDIAAPACGCAAPDGRILEADAARLPFEDVSFDAALFECSLSKMERPAAALREAARVLRPGGRLAVADLFSKGAPRDFNGILGSVRPWPELRENIEAAGFALEHFAEQPRALSSFYAAMIFAQGAQAAAALGADPPALKAARCGYFLAVFTRG